MPTKPTKTKRLTTTVAVARHVRGDQTRALKAAVRAEKLIQRLTKQLQTEMQRSNDRIQGLAVVLSSFARAIETEHDVTRAAQG